MSKIISARESTVQVPTEVQNRFLLVFRTKSMHISSGLKPSIALLRDKLHTIILTTEMF